ncbi:MAG: hypothetical protein J2P38_10325 [Candidatus Dormibacteraeota bacterium]|nr:hypothetical protein [Candidatus Dormibacteraeota bacterium]
MSTQELNLIGHLFLASAVFVGVLQIGLVWALVRRAGKRPPIGPLRPSPDLAVDLLENEIDQLRGELYRLRNERDWLRKECERLARGEDEPGR